MIPYRLNLTFHECHDRTCPSDYEPGWAQTAVEWNYPQTSKQACEALMSLFNINNFESMEWRHWDDLQRIDILNMTAAGTKRYLAGRIILTQGTNKPYHLMKGVQRYVWRRDIAVRLAQLYRLHTKNWYHLRDLQNEYFGPEVLDTFDLFEAEFNKVILTEVDGIFRVLSDDINHIIETKKGSWRQSQHPNTAWETC